jgi:uncharacterized membrane protein HdeD (DUF308 family)
MSESRSPGWVRAAQIGLGVLAVILSITLLVYPRSSVVSIVYLAAVVLLIVGIEKVITGLFASSKSRMASVGLGILVIILSLIVMAFPLSTSIFLIYLLGVALLIYGISRIVHGIGDKERSGWSRWSSLGIGVLMIIISIIIMVLPGAGLAFVGILIGIALLIAGIEIIAAGISGRKMRLLPSRDRGI